MYWYPQALFAAEQLAQVFCLFQQGHVLLGKLTFGPTKTLTIFHDNRSIVGIFCSTHAHIVHIVRIVNIVHTVHTVHIGHIGHIVHSAHTVRSVHTVPYRTVSCHVQWKLHKIWKMMSQRMNSQWEDHLHVHAGRHVQGSIARDLRKISRIWKMMRRI